MSRTRWPGLTSRRSGGTIEAASCLWTCPASAPTIRNAWRSRSATLAAAAVESVAPDSFLRSSNTFREASTCQARRPGYHGSGIHGVDASARAGTCSASSWVRTATALGSSGIPEMRKVTGSGVRRLAVKASQSASSANRAPSCWR
eukprot:scaffold4173_cov117-Isochrysis_galbana.AAC.6